jgi:lactate dehydrogenase-like 2-hydroxyacid dehydrogenase
MVTGHQGSLTTTAQRNIAETTLQNIREFELGRRGAQLSNAVLPAAS